MHQDGGFGSADGSTNWMLRGFGPLWLSAAHIRFIAQNWGAVLKCEHTPRVRFCFSHLLKLNFKVHKSALFVSFRATRHDRTPVLLLAGDRQRFAMPRNLAHCVHIILNTLLQVLHYGIEMSMFLPRDSVRWKKRANFLWDKSVGAIVLPQAR